MRARERERASERARERESERVRGREGERARERESERARERERESVRAVRIGCRGLIIAPGPLGEGAENEGAAAASGSGGIETEGAEGGKRAPAHRKGCTGRLPQHLRQ